MLDFDTYFAAISEDFIAGEFASVARRFDFPMAIYADKRVAVCIEEERLLVTLGRYHRLLKERGADTVKARVVAAPMMRGVSGTVWMEKVYFDARGEIVDTCQLRYFFQIRNSLPRISMLEYLRLPNVIAESSREIYSAA